MSTHGPFPTSPQAFRTHSWQRKFKKQQRKNPSPPGSLPCLPQATLEELPSSLERVAESLASTHGENTGLETGKVGSVWVASDDLPAVPSLSVPTCGTATIMRPQESSGG